METTAVPMGDSTRVFTIDGEEMEIDKARALSRRMYLMGFALLPWMWFTNVWLFWPTLKRGDDPVVKKYTQSSAIGFCIASAIFLPWMLSYLIGGEALFGKDLFRKLDSSRLDLEAYGAPF
ncbi:hypothetical protein BSKO_01054 [Bryopsis sp. KO-2023]|nr:hypothetical protein BSKO_01054 [Bryopsis sp. KO-2023]